MRKASSSSSRPSPLLLLFACYIVQQLSSVTAIVLLKPSSVFFLDLPAKFAPRVNSSGICGALRMADPPDACSSLRNSFDPNQVTFALIIRGNCGFEDKVRNAQSIGFRAAIVYDNKDKRNLVYMMVNAAEIKVPAVFVSKVAGVALKEHAGVGGGGECCIYASHSDRGWTVLSICFISLIVIFAILIVALFAPMRWLSWRQGDFQCSSVDARIVGALPCFTFHSAQLACCAGGETCAICLEDYKHGEVVKVLPCQHEFHQSCVDSWLTKWGIFCPVCKIDVRSKFSYSVVGLLLISDAAEFNGFLHVFDCPPSLGIKYTSMENHSNSRQFLKKRLVSWFFFCFIIIGSLPESTGSDVVTIDVKASKSLLESGYGYIDVRTVEEFKKGHVGTNYKIFNIPYMFNTPEGRVKNPDFLKEVLTVCKEEDHLIVGCQSGVRSLHATADLLTAGFKDVRDMGGGYLAWVENKFAVQKLEEYPKTEL